MNMSSLLELLADAGYILEERFSKTGFEFVKISKLGKVLAITISYAVYETAVVVRMGYDYEKTTFTSITHEKVKSLVDTFCISR